MLKGRVGWGGGRGRVLMSWPDVADPCHSAERRLCPFLSGWWSWGVCCWRVTSAPPMFFIIHSESKQLNGSEWFGGRRNSSGSDPAGSGTTAAFISRAGEKSNILLQNRCKSLCVCVCVCMQKTKSNLWQNKIISSHKWFPRFHWSAEKMWQSSFEVFKMETEGLVADFQLRHPSINWWILDHPGQQDGPCLCVCSQRSNIRVCAPLCPHSHLSVLSHMCAHTCVPPCVFSVDVGSICVTLTRWEPLSAGSPAGPKSSGRPEAWNPSRPGQMSLCSGRLSPLRPRRPLGEASGSRRRPENTDFTPQNTRRPANWMKDGPGMQHVSILLQCILM